MQKFEAFVSKKKFLTKKVCWIELRLLKPEKIKFLPGQFVSLEVEKRQRRSYSICSLDMQADFIELLVDISPGGVGSKFFGRVKAREKVNFLGPMGKFVLQESVDGPLVFLAAGTGIAPFKPMIKRTLDITKLPVFLYLGFRYKEDVFWQEYFRELARKYKNFHFTLTLSQPGLDWQGKTGYVQTHFLPSNLKPQTSNFYICGGRNMVRGVVEFLEKKGIPKERIHFEMY